MLIVSGEQPRSNMVALVARGLGTFTWQVSQYVEPAILTCGAW